MRLTLPTAEDLGKFAAEFARGLRPGDVVALAGPLGAGKTTFVRAVVTALHGADQSCSPSFTFRHRYDGDPPIEHIDLYRIDDPREVTELGLEEAPSTAGRSRWSSGGATRRTLFRRGVTKSKFKAPEINHAFSPFDRPE